LEQSYKNETKPKSVMHKQNNEMQISEQSLCEWENEYDDDFVQSPVGTKAQCNVNEKRVGKFEASLSWREASMDALRKCILEAQALISGRWRSCPKSCNRLSR
jgi:hypothetical protein